jgi:hypothetical protein
MISETKVCQKFPYHAIVSMVATLDCTTPYKRLIGNTLSPIVNDPHIPDLMGAESI